VVAALLMISHLHCLETGAHEDFVPFFHIIFNLTERFLNFRVECKLNEYFPKELLFVIAERILERIAGV
jgi:hypothetical protein